MTAANADARVCYPATVQVYASKQYMQDSCCKGACIKARRTTGCTVWCPQKVRPKCHMKAGGL